LHRAIADAGRWAYGTVLVEMWVLSEDRTCLFRPESAWWVDPVFHKDDECDEDCKVCCLLNSQRKSFVPPDPVAPGEGLPGVLWAETNKSFLQGARSMGGSQRSGHQRSNRRHLSDITGKVFSDAVPGRRVAWRQVGTIAEDPDQPWNQRLHLLAALGLGWAAAVPFSLHGQRGIVVFMARDGVDLELMQTPDNESYLKSASDFAGAAYALRVPRRKMEQARYKERAAAWRRVRARILFLIRKGTSLQDYVNAQSENDDDATIASSVHVAVWRDWLGVAKSKGLFLLRKFRGGGAQPPPGFSWRQTLLTFFGVLGTLLMVGKLNSRLVEEHGGDYAIVMG